MSREVSVFVDGNNLFHSALQQGSTIDYNKLRNVLTDNGEYQKSVFYTGVDVEGSERQGKFLCFMRRNGWRVVSKEVTNNGSRKTSSLKSEIATDLVLSVMNGASAVILASGDEDYVYPLQKLAEHDVKIVIAGFSNSTSNKLLDMADVFIDLTEADIFIEKK